MPTPMIQARAQAAMPMVAAINSEVDTSLRITAPRLRRLTSPNAMARTNVEVI
ncbi:hypothetical protein D3C85_1844070 [compost metagenome]